MNKTQLRIAATAAAAVAGGVAIWSLPATRASATTVPWRVMTATQGDFDSPRPFPSEGLRWLTWVLIGHKPSRAIQFHNAGVKVMYYTFETRQSPITEMWSTVQAKGDAVFALDCSGHRLRSKQNTTYLMNIDSPDLQQAYRSTYIDGIVDRYPIDAVFYDGAGNLWDLVDDQTGEKDAPCVHGHPADPDDWATSHISQAISKIPAKVFYNGLTFWHLNQDAPAAQIALNRLPNVIGGRQEECYLNESRPTGPHQWLAASNTNLAVARDGKLVICQPKDNKTDPASDEGISHRLFAYASFLLTYDPDSTIYWYAGPPRTSNIYPEVQVVALNPVGRDVSNVGQLRRGGDVFGREYRDCYFSGQRVGSCAVAVNMNRQRSGSFPFAAYVGNAHAHVLTLSGADVLQGGSASPNGGPAPSELEPSTGVIVFDTSR